MNKHKTITEYHKFFKKETLNARTNIPDFPTLKSLVLFTAEAHFHAGITFAEVRDHMITDGFVVSPAKVASAWWALIDSGALSLDAKEE